MHVCADIDVRRGHSVIEGHSSNWKDKTQDEGDIVLVH